MKKVSFGDDQIIHVENISDYLIPESGFLHLIYKSMIKIKDMRIGFLFNRDVILVKISIIVREIVDHPNVKSLVISMPENIEDRFTSNIVSMFKMCFELHKTCLVRESKTVSLSFIDDISNPSVNEYLECTENWKDRFE